MLNKEFIKILNDLEIVILNSNLPKNDLEQEISVFLFEVRKLMSKAKKQNVIQHYAEGAVKAVKAMTLPETEESKARLAVCHGCDKWTGTSCKVCGCFVNLKVKMPEEKCPEGKW
jgi:hypothetical protein